MNRLSDTDNLHVSIDLLAHYSVQVFIIYYHINQINHVRYMKKAVNVHI